MSKIRYLTKSRFKLGCECPTKLFYTSKKDLYKDCKGEDPFLEALAEGGFQIGELAKYYYPGGHDIETLDYEESLAQTNELLKQDEVTIYEAAIKYENLFIRVDVLKKVGNQLYVIEVKSKSCDPKAFPDEVLTRKNTIQSTWKPYVEDIAFQSYVVEHAFPNMKVFPSLLLVDKSSIASTTGLNQKFKITSKDGRKGIKLVADITSEDLENKILVSRLASNYIHYLKSEVYEYDGKEYHFDDYIKLLSELYAKDEKAVTEIGSKCNKCEFKTSLEDENEGLKSGYKECWSQVLAWSDNEFNKPNILDVWNFRSCDKHIKENNKYKMTDLDESDFDFPRFNDKKLSAKERQWLQVSKSQSGNKEPYIKSTELRSEMSSWKYPLHFIDFETSMVAIPFYKGSRPYEGIAFQFSHHTYSKEGEIQHQSEYISVESGVFPNFEFVRRLKNSLDNDSGTIFRYSNHENTYLNIIYWQLEAHRDSVGDADELQDFIKSITKSKKDSPRSWKGSRNMVDLWEMVKNYYYHPATNGSNSIKHVFPAILNSSKFLQEKYSQPIYGSEYGIKSHNFKDKAWVTYDPKGNIIDPYSQLPDLFSKSEENVIEGLELYSDCFKLANGGAAMTAFAKMQFSNMSDLEREELKRALLRYCELDTLAMVMIYEGLKEMVY